MAAASSGGGGAGGGGGSTATSDRSVICYTVDICTECMEQVDLDQTACPMPCVKHPNAEVKTMVVDLTREQAEAALVETDRRDEVLAEQIRRGEI